MPYISGAQGTMSGASSGFMMGGPTGAVVGGIVGGVIGISSGIFGRQRQQQAAGLQRDIAGLQEEMIGEQLAMDSFQRETQRAQTARQTQVAESRIRAASVARGIGLGSSVAQQATQSGRAQQAETFRDVTRGRTATETMLDIQRQQAEKQSQLQALG